jgi:hypothetical protein
MSCPVVETIKEIYGAGIFIDEFDNDSLVKIGGGNVEYLCDSAKFYITTRKMEFARYELNDVEFKNLKNGFFDNIVDKSYKEIYEFIIDKVLNNKYVYNQFVNLINLIDVMEKALLRRIHRLGKEKKEINVSIPDMMFSTNVDTLILYRPDVLCETVNTIISYIMRLNIRSIIKESVSIDIKKIDAFPHKLDMEIVVAGPLNTNEDAKRILQHEMVVADHVLKLEKYHCEVINQLNKIYHYCDKIIENL